MKWIPDNTGRFSIRPYYEPGEIDAACDTFITEFLQKKYGCAKMPLRTADLETLLEIRTSDFDPYADLEHEGDDIEGVTYFVKDNLPAVKISEELSIHHWQENRRRTTLAHELGHVVFHSELANKNLLTKNDDPSLQSIRCNRQNITAAKEVDWLEWQAYYASGAYLMPRFYVNDLAKQIFDLVKLNWPFLISSSLGYGFVSRVVNACKVSKAAAQVRLIQMGYLTNDKAIATIY